ncbi:MAG TPA: hypothetical protein DCL21_00105 [Alphaproteobacteria bacterium]|nr:hypothetical protein [Alphaproteobacteria bacterium]
MNILGEQFFTILNMDKDFAFKLADMLEKSTNELLEQLRKAVENADSKKSKDILHTIKGSAANFGAEELMEQARDIESAIYLLNKDNIKEYKECIVNLNNTLQRTLKEIENHK